MVKGTPREIRIGTRGSTLALAQTEEVRAQLVSRHADTAFLIQVITTMGDKKQETPMAAFGDKKDWVFECEEALNDGSIDIAIHSGKDVPVDIHPGTELLPVLPRRAPFDAIRGRTVSGASGQDEGLRILRELPKNAVVATASLRRSAQIKAFRPDLQISPIRGNVPTRIRKFLGNPELDAIILATAGLERLALESAGFVPLPIEVMLPAVNQGILLAQFLSSRNDVRELLSPLVHTETLAASVAERQCISILRADCHSAVGAFADVTDGRLRLRSRAYSTDGSETIEEEEIAGFDDATNLGTSVAERLLERGAAKLLFPE